MHANGKNLTVKPNWVNLMTAQPFFCLDDVACVKKADKILVVSFVSLRLSVYRPIADILRAFHLYGFWAVLMVAINRELR